MLAQFIYKPAWSTEKLFAMKKLEIQYSNYDYWRKEVFITLAMYICILIIVGG